MESCRDAVLLIGPTGAGKSPLGDFLEGRGLGGRRAHHFDFGANLRRVAAGGMPGFPPEEVTFVQEILKAGALLENETFNIARKILRGFEGERQLEANDLLILNGLPRHAGQAEAMADLVRVRLVVELVGTPEVILERLRHNRGGDRTGRDDDRLDLVRRKLAIFTERTVPLVAWYRERGVAVCCVEVTAAQLPAAIAGMLPPLPPAD